MKTVFARISAAIVATVAVVASVLVVQPAFASPSANPVSYSNYNLSKEIVGTQANPTTASPVNTIAVPAGTDDFTQYITIRIGTDLAKSLAGHTIRVDWNKSFPAGVDFYTPTTPGVARSVSFYGSGGFSFSGSDWTEMNTKIITDDVTDPTDSSLITVPASVANAMTGQGISLSTSIQKYDDALAGNYSYAPTFYDKTAGAALTLSPTADFGYSSANTNVASATQVNWTMGGSGQFLGDVPAGGNMTQWATTCVSKSDLVVGNRLELARLVNGAASTAPMYGGANIYPKGSNNTTVGRFEPQYTVVSADTDAAATGFRVGYSIPADNSSGSTPLTVTSSGLTVTDIDAATQVQSSCAAETPAAPTFVLDGRSNATVTWTKIATDALNQWNQSNTAYYLSLFKASDPATPVFTGELNGSLSGSTYTSSVYFTTHSPTWSQYQADANTDYFIKISATDDVDNVESELSAASGTSQLVGPAAPTNPALTLNSLSNATITWSPSAGDTGSGFGYAYEIYTQADQSTAVRSGGMNPQLSNGSYTASVGFMNQTTWMPDPLVVNTNYVVKIRATKFSLNLESAWSVASAPAAITGPATPNKPVITSMTSSSLTASLTVRQGETNFMYSAAAYASTDSSFTNPLGSGSCGSPTQGSLAYTCNVMPSMGGSFSSSVNYVVRVTANNNGLMSAPSPASDAVAGPLTGVVFSQAPSQGTANGKAKSLTSTFPWITSSYTEYGISAGRVFPDGLGNFFAINDAGALLDGSSVAIGRNFDVRKLKADNTGFDSTFGTVTMNVPGGTALNTNTLPGVTFFAGGTSMASITSTSGLIILREATVGSGFSAGVSVAQSARDFCAAHADAGVGTVSNVSAYALGGFQALSRPVVTVNCQGTASQQFAATVAADGTFSKLFAFNSVNSTQNSLNSRSISTNSGATGSEVATVVYAVRTLNSGGVNSNYDRVIFRVKADGTVETTLNALPTASSSTSSPSVTLAPVHDGTTVHALVNTLGSHALAAIPVATGGVGSLTPLSAIYASMSSQLSFPGSSVPVVNGELALVRKNQTGMSAISYSPLRVNAATGDIIEGEIVSMGSPGSALFYPYIDAAGNMNAIYTPAVQGVTTHSVLQWKNVRSQTNSVTPPGPTPPSGATPVYASKDVLLSINGGGTLMTITGTDMNSSLITGVRFGTSSALAGVKTATTLKVSVPASSVAGVETAPSLDEPATVPVSIVLSDGTSVPAGTITYIGASKIAQIITTVVDTATAFVGSPDRDLSVDNFTGFTSVTPQVTPVLTPSTVCTLVNNKVRFVGAGTCKITTSSPGNNFMAAGSDTKTITVVKQDQEISVLVNNEPAVVGEADRDITVTNETSLTPAAAVTPVLTPSSVCTLVANKVHFVGAGTCKVTVQAIGDATFNASRVEVRSITVTKQNQELAVGLSTVAALVGEPDRAINITTATGLTPNGATITPVLTPASVCTLVDSKVHFVGPGVCTVTTKADASAMFNASGVNIKKITVAKQSQELAVGLSTSTAFVGEADRDITVTNQTSLSPGAVVTPVPSPASVCTLVAGKIRFVGAGTCTVKSQALATSMFNASPLSVKSIKVNKQNQVLTVGLVTTPAYIGEADRTISVTNTTSLTAGAAVTPVLSPASVCTLVAEKIHFVGPGKCSIKSQAAGSGTFNASAATTKVITVAKQNQRVVTTVLTTPALVTDADRDIAVVNTTSLTAGAVVVPDLKPASVCTLVANKVHFVGPGTCTIKASSAATSTFNASNLDTKVIIVRKAEAITVTPNSFVTDDSVGGFEVPARTVSGRAITYTVNPTSSTVCSYDKALRVIKGKTGRGANNNCVVTLSVPADAAWAAASSVQTFTITTAVVNTEASALVVANSNSAVSHKNMAFTWDRTSGDLKVTHSSVFIGPMTAKISWKVGAVTHTCTSASFGGTTAVTGNDIEANKTFTSAGVCAGASQAAKLALLKTIDPTTVVKVEISRQLNDPKTNKSGAKVSVAPVYLKLAS